MWLLNDVSDHITVTVSLDDRSLKHIPEILSIILLRRYEVALLLRLPLLFRAIHSVQFLVLKYQQRPQPQAEEQVEEHECGTDP